MNKHLAMDSIVALCLLGAFIAAVVRSDVAVTVMQIGIAIVTKLHTLRKD